MQHRARHIAAVVAGEEQEAGRDLIGFARPLHRRALPEMRDLLDRRAAARVERGPDRPRRDRVDANALLHQIRSEEHTSELQSLMRISYAVFCLKKKKHTHNNPPLANHTT